MGIPASKPTNFDALAATWNDPRALAVERARYHAQLRAERIDEYADVTEPHLCQMTHLNPTPNEGETS